MTSTRAKLLATGIFLLAFIGALVAMGSNTSWSFKVAKIHHKIVRLFATTPEPEGFWPATIRKLDQKLLSLPVLFIAHAGGGYKKSTYTNSLDALEQTYRDGVRFFELDFMRTRDGKIVCIHDWRNGYLTYEEFKAKRYDQSNFLMKFNNCDLDGLGEFLAARPDASLILDTKIDEEKENREEAVPFLREVVDNLAKKHGIPLERLVPQGYTLDQTKQYKAAGFPHVIFTLYKTKGQQDLEAACELGGVAITTNVLWIINGRTKVNEESNPEYCPVFVHPVDKLEELRKAIAIAPQIRGVYTSFLRPE